MVDNWYTKITLINTTKMKKPQVLDILDRNATKCNVNICLLRDSYQEKRKLIDKLQKESDDLLSFCANCDKNKVIK